MNLVSLVAQKTGWTKGESREAIEAVTESLKELAYAYGTIRVGKLGSLYLKEVGERSGTSKLQGEAKNWVVPAHYDMVFSANRETMSYINSADFPDYVESKNLSPYEGDYLNVDEEAEEAEKTEYDDNEPQF